MHNVLLVFQLICWERDALFALFCVVCCHFTRCVLIHIRIKGEDDTVKHVKALQDSKVVVLLLLTFCLLLLPLWKSVIVLCLVVRYFMSILVL